MSEYERVVAACFDAETAVLVPLAAPFLERVWTANTIELRAVDRDAGALWDNRHSDFSTPGRVVIQLIALVLRQRLGMDASVGRTVLKNEQEIDRVLGDQVLGPVINWAEGAPRVPRTITSDLVVRSSSPAVGLLEFIADQLHRIRPDWVNLQVEWIRRGDWLERGSPTECNLVLLTLAALRRADVSGFRRRARIPGTTEWLMRHRGVEMWRQRGWSGWSILQDLDFFPVGPPESPPSHLPWWVALGVSLLAAALVYVWAVTGARNKVGEALSAITSIADSAR